MKSKRLTAENGDDARTGFRCPSCRQQGRVHVGNTERRGEVTVRYRICNDCGHHFKTHEYVAALKQDRRLAAS